MATAALSANFIDIVAAEMSSGVERAVEYWLAQIDLVVVNDNIEPSVQLASIREIVHNYERLTGKRLLKFSCFQ